MIIKFKSFDIVWDYICNFKKQEANNIKYLQNYAESSFEYCSKFLLKFCVKIVLMGMFESMFLEKIEDGKRVFYTKKKFITESIYLPKT